MLSIILLSLGCKVNDSTNVNGPKDGSDDVCENLTRDAEISAPYDVSVVRSDVLFAMDLWDELQTKDQNQFISPYSMTSALGLLHLGARNETAAEMSSVMHIEDEGTWHDSKGVLTQELHQPNRCDYQLSIANRLFAQKGFPFHSEYQEEVESIYNAPVEVADFAADTENARLRINAWVSEQTKGNVPELFKPSSLTPSTRLVLANAIYLNAPWSSPFEAELTHKANFATESGSEVSVDMMTQSEMDIQYYVDEQLTAATLPYEGNELSMTFYLPNEDFTLLDIESGLNGERYESIQATQQPVLGSVSIPKFEFRTTLVLNDSLTNLGMVSLFGPSADLSGVSEVDLMVNSVVHEAWIKVEEKGTEAAAATGIDAGLTSVPEMEYFKADKAFLFTIQDDLTETLLFIGRVADPTIGE